MRSLTDDAAVRVREQSKLRAALRDDRAYSSSFVVAIPDYGSITEVQLEEIESLAMRTMRRNRGLLSLFADHVHLRPGLLDFLRRPGPCGPVHDALIMAGDLSFVNTSASGVMRKWEDLHDST